MGWEDTRGRNKEGTARREQINPVLAAPVRWEEGGGRGLRGVMRVFGVDGFVLLHKIGDGGVGDGGA